MAAAPAGDSSGGDRYRSHLAGEGEKNTVWRHGAPPTYDAVNSLFESGRTQEWPEGSLEETVQNAIKTWEMELSHKARLADFKSVSPGRFTLSVNGGRALTGEETLAVGSYNVLLASPILPATGAYDAAAESSHDLFRSAFPRGFACSCKIKQKQKGSDRILMPSVEGQQAGKWVVIDSGSIIIHALEERAREYYDLESIWTKAVSPNISAQEFETSLVKTRRRDHSQKPMKSI